ncbi:MAG TPA: hypothetical protein VGK59_21305 [Ohtaekwangia sp.]
MAKTGKDREGKYHPPKGSPSGRKKEKKTVEQGNNITDDLDDMDSAGSIHFRHPNRNRQKNDERTAKKDVITTAKNSTAVSAAPATGSPVVPDEILSMNTEALKMLESVSASPCISIYLPTHSSGVEVNERKDFIAFKNSIQQVTAELKQKALRDDHIQKLLSPAYDLLRNDVFWNALSPGLAVFIAENFFRVYKMPLSPAASVTTGKSFRVRPLVQILMATEYFYVLVISKKQALFYKADAFNMTPIPVPEMPDGVEDVVHFENKDDQKLFRTGSSGAGKGANYHGIGAGKPDDKENIRMYLDEVDETLWKEKLNTEARPLVLAGVEYLLPIFKDVTQYNYVWDDALTGSFENESLTTLHTRALEILKPYFDQAKNKALEKYGNKSVTELTSSVPADVIPASYYGRVDTLFISKDAALWGTFDKNANILTLHDTPEDGDDSLLEAAITQTYLNGGQVYELDKTEMPEGAAVAALMRY